jgi:exosome complex RNA-binding protein Csl4
VKTTQIGKFKMGDIVKVKVTAIGKDDQTVDSAIYKCGVSH